MGEHIIIVGAGQSGASVALALHEQGFDGTITLLGEEPHPPYQRPPLSKKYLAGEWGADRLYLRPAEAWAGLGVTLRTGARVETLDASARTLRVNGETLDWDKLVLATGAVSRPVPPAFAGKGNLHELRTLADVDALQTAFRPGQRLAVIGGGFIGLETAAVAAKAGLAVLVIERAPRILERAVGAATSDILRERLQALGVRLMEGTEVAEVRGTANVEALVLPDGTVEPVDAVLIGIGVLPATALAQAAGLACDNGIAVDEFGRSSAPGIWACGDCASFPYHGARLRLESVQNAVDQAKAVALDMLGRGAPYVPHPWFWSDQGETKLQIAGLFNGATDVIRRPGKSGCSFWYYRARTLIAVEAIDEPAAFMTGRKLLEAGISPEPEAFSDENFDPRRLLR